MVLIQYPTVKPLVAPVMTTASTSSSIAYRTKTIHTVTLGVCNDSVKIFSFAVPDEFNHVFLKTSDTQVNAIDHITITEGSVDKADYNVLDNTTLSFLENDAVTGIDMTAFFPPSPLRPPLRPLRPLRPVISKEPLTVSVVMMSETQQSEKYGIPMHVLDACNGLKSSPLVFEFVLDSICPPLRTIYPLSSVRCFEQKHQTLSRGQPLKFDMNIRHDDIVPQFFVIGISSEYRCAKLDTATVRFRQASNVENVEDEAVNTATTISLEEWTEQDGTEFPSNLKPSKCKMNVTYYAIRLGPRQDESQEPDRLIVGSCGILPLGKVNVTLHAFGESKQQ